jgi:membrane protease YdiL (CAAX protease family)
MNNLIVLQIIFLYILPVILIFILPKKWKMPILITVFSILIFLIFYENWTWTQLGIRLDNLYQGIAPYLIYTLLCSIMIIFISHKLHIRAINNWQRQPHFMFLFVFVSFFQELAYRGFLIPKLMTLFNSVFWVIISNTLIFMFIHIIYKNKLVNLSLTFIMGIIFAWSYIYFPNLILITISHSILNFLAVLYGWVSDSRIESKIKFKT